MHHYVPCACPNSTTNLPKFSFSEYAKEGHPGANAGARADIRTDTLGGSMKTATFFNNKGGVGKTTLAVHLALRAAMHHNLRTIAQGLDRQGTCCAGFRVATCRLAMVRSSSTAPT